MDHHGADQLTTRLPDQSPPISRDKQMEEAHLGQSGVEASQTACDNLITRRHPDSVQPQPRPRARQLKKGGMRDERN